MLATAHLLSLTSKGSLNLAKESMSFFSVAFSTRFRGLQQNTLDMVWEKLTFVAWHSKYKWCCFPVSDHDIIHHWSMTSLPYSSKKTGFHFVPTTTALILINTMWGTVINQTNFYNQDERQHCFLSLLDPMFSNFMRCNDGTYFWTV